MRSRAVQPCLVRPLKGAYIYKSENGEESLVGPGQYLPVPGSDRHVSSGGPKGGAMFYEDSQGKFDLNPWAEK